MDITTRIWYVLSGLYLVAYLFWFGFPRFGLADYFGAATTFVPAPFNGLLGSVFATFTLIGAVLMWDIGWSTDDVQPWRCFGGLVGGLALLPWALTYLPETNRVVPHWPLDLGVTIVAPLALFRDAWRFR